MMKRLCLPLVLWCTVTAVHSQTAPAPAPSLTRITLDELKAQRKELAAKKRRIIMNNDANESIFKVREVSTEALLKIRSTGLEGSQVGAIFYATGHSFSVVNHETKVGTVSSASNPKTPNLTKEYIKAGLDPLKVFINFAHKNGMDLFWSFRVDDTHDAGGKEDFSANPFKSNNPDLIMGPQTDTTLARGSWSAVDYGKEKVRDMAFRLNEEVCQNFDVDGLEWDFFRHTLYFKNTALGQPCTQEQRDQMTELVRRVRLMSETEGLKRGRPILMAVRVPDSLEYCRDIGLDVERWLKEDLIDILVTTGYTQMNPWKYSADLAHKYGKPLYASVENSRVKDDEEAVARRQDMLGRRGRVMDALRAGADGVYTFNLFDPTSPFWRECGDMEALNTLDKDYFATFVGVGREYGLPYLPYIKMFLMTSQNPQKLKADRTLKVPLEMSDDFAAAKAKGFTPTTKLRVLFKAPPTGISLALNGQPLQAQVEDERWLGATVDPALLKMGANEFEIIAGPQANVGQDLVLEVRYQSAAKP